MFILTPPPSAHAIPSGVLTGNSKIIHYEIPQKVRPPLASTECWNVGMLEYWNIGGGHDMAVLQGFSAACRGPLFQHSIIPSLHHSITPVFRQRMQSGLDWSEGLGKERYER